MSDSHLPTDATDAAGPVLPGRLARLRDELADEGVPALDGAFEPLPGLVELAYALRPPVHEGSAPAYGAILRRGGIDPRALDLGPLDHALVDVHELDGRLVRRFADGMRTFVVRDEHGLGPLVCFGRAMSREYDLVILQGLLDALIVQRHPSGQVRTYGSAGVTRWDGIGWHHDQPIDDLTEQVGRDCHGVPQRDLRVLLLFAVHELSPRRIGATLVWRPASPLPDRLRWEARHDRVPPVSLTVPGGPAAIASALAQTDGATIFHEGAVMSALGVQLLASPRAEAEIALLGGTRHTSGLRYSFDDPESVVIVVSEDGPVSVMVRGRSVRVDDRERLIG